MQIYFCVKRQANDDFWKMSKAQCHMDTLQSFCYQFVKKHNVCRQQVASLAADIMKTCLYNFNPLKPHFYMVKLGFTQVYIIYLILLKNRDCGTSTC